MDPATAMMIISLTRTGLGFISNRGANKQALQELNTNRLLAQLKGLSVTNDINDIADETKANNYTSASTMGYSPLESASFRAIQSRVDSKRDEDIFNKEVIKNMQTQNTLLRNSNFNQKFLLHRVKGGYKN